jgi:hypothetical protein
MILKPNCTLKLSENLLKIPMSRPHPSQLNLNPLGDAKALVSFKKPIER